MASRGLGSGAGLGPVRGILKCHKSFYPSRNRECSCRCEYSFEASFIMILNSSIVSLPSPFKSAFSNNSLTLLTAFSCRDGSSEDGTRKLLPEYSDMPGRNGHCYTARIDTWRLILPVLSGHALSATLLWGCLLTWPWLVSLCML